MKKDEYEQIKFVKEQTGCGNDECKETLVNFDYDTDKAIEFLQAKYPNTKTELSKKEKTKFSLYKYFSKKRADRRVAIEYLSDKKLFRLQALFVCSAFLLFCAIGAVFTYAYMEGLLGKIYIISILAGLAVCFILCFIKGAQLSVEHRNRQRNYK